MTCKSLVKPIQLLELTKITIAEKVSNIFNFSFDLVSETTIVLKKKNNISGLHDRNCRQLIVFVYSKRFATFQMMFFCHTNPISCIQIAKKNTGDREKKQMTKTELKIITSEKSRKKSLNILFSVLVK